MKKSHFNIILSDVGGVLIKNYDATIEDVRVNVALPEASFMPIWRKEIEAYGTYGNESEFWEAFARQGGNKVEADGLILRAGFEANLQIYHRVIDLMKQS